MPFKILVGALAALVVATPCLAAPLDAYGRLPQIEQVSISPDGKLLAMTVTDGDKRNIVIRDAATNQTIAALGAGDQKVRFLQWGGPDFLLITGSSSAHLDDVFGPRQEHYVTLFYDIKAKRQHYLLAGVSQALNVTVGPPQVRMVKGSPTAIVKGVRFDDGGRGRLSLFSVDLPTDRVSLLEPGVTDTNDWQVGPNGEALAQSQFDAKNGHWSILLKRASAWQPVLQGDRALGGPNIISLARDGRSLLIGPAEDGDDTLREYDPQTAAWGQPLPQAHLQGLLNDGLTDRLLGGSLVSGDTHRYVFFDPKDQAIWDAVAKAYPGDDVKLESWSTDHQHIVALVDSRTDGPAYALIDLTTKHGGWIGSVYRGVGSADISPVTAINYRAADGQRISGYLTLPKGRDPKGLPLVVLPHGGPATRDVLAFDWWAQALASRGYAVLQANYRGSAGFGYEFLSAGFGQWGRKMQTDLSDGVRFLASQGTIDAKRVCIVGASYGGYAALAGAAIDRGVYRCAASVSGPADLARFLSTAKTDHGDSSFRYWNRFLGVDGPRDPKLAEISPVAQAAKIEIPVLLVHGKADTVVAYEQSQLMADALKKAGKPVEFVTLDSEDHWLSRGETRLKMLQAVTAFLEKNNPPG